MFAILNSLFARNRFLVPVCLSLSLAFGMAWVAEANTTFTVTTTADNGNNANPTPGSLRAAILSANSNPGMDNISFSIGSGLQTIQPLTQLPNISDDVVIDGTTQPGFAGAPMIEIDGSLTTNSSGLVVTSKAGSTIKGLVINRFNASGITLAGNGGHVIAGNYIGTNSTGNANFPKPNNGVGISLLSPNNIIGGLTPADRNIVSGNQGSTTLGIDVLGANAIGNKIIGNYVGTDVTGTLSLGQVNGGIRLGNVVGTIVGGPTAAERNVISGNFSGIDIVGGHDNKIQGNYIGTKPDGTGGLTAGFGVYIEGASQNNVIGGTNPGEGNLIPASVNRGVVVNDTCIGNAILGNSITSSVIGIDLKSDGITPNDFGATMNDPSDADTGPNKLQNFPVINTVVPNGSNTVIDGTLRSEAGKTYRIELFSNTACNPSGFGGGRFFVAATNTSTDASGNANFNFTIPTASITGAIFTVTATDPENNTSELSQCQSNAPPANGTIQFGASSLTVNESTGQASVTVTRTGGSIGAVSVHYATSDGLAHAAAPDSDYTTKSAQLDFANGETSKNIIIDLTNDSVSEPTEDFKITLSSPTGGAVLGPQKVINVIIGDDDAPTFAISDVQVAEGNSGTTTNATFTISLNRASFKVVTVDYLTDIIGTATSGNDYQPTGGTVTFNIGETSKPVTVLINGDDTPEPNETFVVKLLNNNGVGISDFTGTGTILDDDTPASSTLQFSSANYYAQEDLTALTITVTRTGDTSGAASVNYGSTDGTATQKGDFELVLGTLNFAPGEATKTFQVLINEDMYVEGNESFTLSLSSPSGASLGQQNTAAVIINDDAPESLVNPIDDSQSFIHMQYHDFLSREPDPQGLQFYLDILNGCQPGDAECFRYTRGALSANFFRSPEFQAKGSYVMYLYMVSIGQRPVTAAELPSHNDPTRNDRPHYAEFMADVQTITSPDDKSGPDPAKKAALTAAWVQRPEIIALYPANLTNAQFAQSLANTAGVTLSAPTQNAVAAAFTRAEILRIIVESPEVNAKFYKQAFVTMQYFGYLRRDPEDCHDSQNWFGTGDPNACGYIFHNNRFQLVADPDFLENTIVRGFIESPEYRQRFGP